LLSQLAEVIDVFRAGTAEDANIATDAGLGELARVLQGRASDQRRRGVGHGQHAGESTGQRGRGAAGEVLLVLAAGHAQMGVEVDQTGESQSCHGFPSETEFLPKKLGFSLVTKKHPIRRESG